MSNETLFYAFGIALVLVALVVSAVGIRAGERFPGRAGLVGTAFLVIALVAGTATFAVLNAEDEQEHRDAELAAEHATEQPEGTEGEQQGGEFQTGEGAPQGGEAKPQQPKAKGPGGTVQLAAETNALAYDEKTLTSKPGEVTVDFTNPSQIEHDVVIAKGSQVLGQTDLIAASETSATTALGPGAYTFYCSVPGHREAGMQGTLSVK